MGEGKGALVTLIPGDGIGPEVIAATVRAVAAAGGEIRWENALAGAIAERELGEPLPVATLEALRRTGLALKGPLATPIGGGYTSVNVTLRRAFDLFANIRPVCSWPGVASRYQDVDLVIVRENTEGMYSGLEQSLSPDGEVGRTVSQITRKGSERIGRAAFEHAARSGRRQVCVVHKANILKLTSGLFLDTVRGLAKDYPGIELRELIVDNACMQLVLDPTRFDVIVTTNLFGDILSDLCAGLVGGLGLAPGANIGPSGAIFEAVHGTAPDIAGRGLANPAATMLAAVMLLEHIGQVGPARALRDAVAGALRDPDARTADLGGTGTTATFTDRVAGLASSPPSGQTA
jgi:isocitrate dehydrogenase (NAD+)